MHRLQTFLWHNSHCCFLLKNILNLVLVQWKQIFPFSIWALRSGSHKLSSLLRDKALRMCISSSWDKVRVGVDFSAWKEEKKWVSERYVPMRFWAGICSDVSSREPEIWVFGFWNLHSPLSNGLKKKLYIYQFKKNNLCFCKCSNTC